jgi:C4-dicarboxylate-specific signal transduction histidine kinase
MDNVPCGYLTINDSRLVVEVSDRTLQLLGKAREEVLDRKLSSFLPPGSRMFFQTHVFPELALSGVIEEIYLSVYCARGELPVLLNAVRRQDCEPPLYDFAFLPIYRRALFERELRQAREQASDATESERRARAEVQTIQAQLTFADRLAIVGTLAAGVAHEVNNPLACIVANLENLRAMIAETEKIEESVKGDWFELADDALDGSLRIQKIVGDLKLLSKNQAPVRSEVDIGRVVTTAIRLSAPSLRFHAPVILEGKTSDVFVLGDEGRLVQVMVNLLLNAAQALPERQSHVNRVRVVIGEDEMGQVTVEVQDNGSGIPEAVRKNIFDPFFTTKSTGTGLGLSVCHNIMCELGGSIEVDSEEGVGTTFRLVFPRRHMSEHDSNHARSA